MAAGGGLAAAATRQRASATIAPGSEPPRNVKAGRWRHVRHEQKLHDLAQRRAALRQQVWPLQAGKHETRTTP